MLAEQKRNLNKKVSLSQEFFGKLFGGSKKEEDKKKSLSQIEAMIISYFFTKDKLSSYKKFADNVGSINEKLLVSSNKELNTSDDDKAFKKWQDTIQKEINNVIKSADGLDKDVMNFLKLINGKSKDIDELHKEGGKCLFLTTGPIIDGEGYIQVASINPNGEVSDRQITVSELTEGFNNLNENKKAEILNKLFSNISKLDLEDSVGVWKKFDELYDRFNDGEFGDYDDNLNDKLTWFWGVCDQSNSDVKIARHTPKEEILSSLENLLSLKTAEPATESYKNLNRKVKGLGMKKKLLQGSFEDFENNEAIEANEVDPEVVKEQVQVEIEDREEDEQIEEIVNLGEEVEQEAVNIAAVEGEELPEGVEPTIDPEDAQTGAEALEEAVIEQEASLENYSKFFGAPNRKVILKTVTEDFGTGLWARYKKNHVAKRILLQKAIEAFNQNSKVSFFDKVKNKVQTIKGEAKYYMAKGNELINEAKNLSNTELDTQGELTMRSEVMLSGLPMICLNNFMSLYKEKVEIKSLTGFPTLTCQVTDLVNKRSDKLGEYIPIAVGNSPVCKNTESESIYVVRGLDKNEDTTRKGLVLLELKSSNGRKFKSTQEVIKSMEELSKVYQDHANILSGYTKTLTNWAKIYGTDIGTLLAGLGIGGVSAIGSRDIAGAISSKIVGTGFKNLGINVAASGTGFIGGAIAGGVAGRTIAGGVWNMLGFGAMKTLFKAQMIYKELYLTQKELRGLFIKSSTSTESFKRKPKTKTNTHGVSIAEEFFGKLFGGKKFRILSNIDFEASNEDKGEFIPNSIFENEFFTILAKNNEGFESLGEFDVEDIKNAVDNLKSEKGEIEHQLGLVKKYKLSKEFTELKVVKEKEYNDSFSYEAGEKSLKYYTDDCLGPIKESLTKAESSDKKAAGLIKEFIKNAEEGLKKTKEYLDYCKKLIQVEEAK